MSKINLILNNRIFPRNWSKYAGQIEGAYPSTGASIPQLAQVCRARNEGRVLVPTLSKR